MADQISYPTGLKIFRRRHNEREVLSSLMDQLADYCPGLLTASTCLSIGTGYGDYDLEFIRRCMPNLKKLIAVEVNRDCVRELKMNLNENFKDNFEVEIFEMSVERLMDFCKEVDGNLSHKTKVNQVNLIDINPFQQLNRGNIDIILALHIIYALNEQNRIRFYNMCFDRWLKPNKGRLVFANSNEENDLIRMLNLLGAEPFLLSETIKSELLICGVNIVKDIKYKGPLNLSNYDVDLFRMFCFSFKRSDVNEVSIAKAMKIVAPNGQAYYCCDLCICEKNH